MTSASEHEGSLYFVTDPICSWCWGMLPEWQILMEEFKDRLQFKLRCAGLQVGSREPLSKEHRDELTRLWQRVHETTGQMFSFSFPDDAEFIYHSEIPCRALQVVRKEMNIEPWALFHDMQEAFYLRACNLSDLESLWQLVKPYGLDQKRFISQMKDDGIRDVTREEFEWCKEQVIPALPSVMLDLGEGPKLICGGYATTEYLIPELRSRLTTH